VMSSRHSLHPQSFGFPAKEKASNFLQDQFPRRPSFSTALPTSNSRAGLLWERKKKRKETLSKFL